MTRTIDKHLAAIRSGTVTQSNIIGLRKAINADERRRQGLSTSRTCPNVTSADVFEAIDAIRLHQPRADSALTESGKARLRDKRYAKRWNDSQRRTIETLTHFTLCGFTEFNRSAIPIWRVHGTSGSFRFINPSWQSGGDGPEIY